MSGQKELSYPQVNPAETPQGNFEGQLTVYRDINDRYVQKIADAHALLRETQRELKLTQDALRKSQERLIDLQGRLGITGRADPECTEGDMDKAREDFSSYKMQEARLEYPGGKK